MKMRAYVVATCWLIGVSSISMGAPVASNSPDRPGAPTTIAGELRGDDSAILQETDSDVARRIVKASELYALGKFEDAEVMLHAILNENGPDPQINTLARRWLILSVMEQRPFPVERAEALAESLSTSDVMSSVDVWNLLLRLLFRQVYAVSLDSKVDVWDRGIIRLQSSAETMRLDTAALAELDRFLMLSDAERGINQIRALTDLLLLIPEVDTMLELNRRRRDTYDKMQHKDDAIGSALLQIALAISREDELIPAINAYASLLPPDEDYAGSNDSTKGLYRLSISPPEGRDRYEPIYDSILSDAAVARLANLSDTEHRCRAWLSILSGDGVGAINAIDLALEESTVWRLGSRWDDAAVIAVAATGDLRNADRKARWYAQQMNYNAEVTRPVRGLARTYDDHNQILDSAVGKLDHSSPVINLFAVSTELSRWADRRSAWTRAAAEAERMDLFVALWVHRISTMDPEDSFYDTPGIGLLDTQLQAIQDYAKAIAWLDKIVAKLEGHPAHDELEMLQAEYLYEAGRYEECVIRLDRTEIDINRPWDESKHIVAGLMRAVAMIKMGDVGEAEIILIEIGRWRGMPEQMARVAFLRGWVYLSYNEPTKALHYLRAVVDEYPSTSYSARSREMIRRLEKVSLSQ